MDDASNASTTALHIARSLQRRRGFRPGPESHAVQWRRTAIERLLPHRSPFLLIDQVTHVDLPRRELRATKSIDAGDPVLLGHFPGAPIYPAVLQIEAIAQAASCLWTCVRAGTIDLEHLPEPRDVRLIKIAHAAFLSEARPPADLVVDVTLVDCDEIAATVAGRVADDDETCSVAVLEVYGAG